MKSRFNKAKTINLSFFVFCFFILPLFAQAFDASKINMEELELDLISLYGGDVARGSFVIDNNSEEIIDLDYGISLLQSGKVFGEQMFEVGRKIQTGGSIKQEFIYDIPFNIKSGDYTLKIQLFSKDGIALNWSEQKIGIESNGIYLNITDSSILKNKQNFNSKLAVDFYSDEIPAIFFIVYNPIDKTVTFKPHIILFKDQFGIDELDNYFTDEIDLLPKKNQSITIDLPQFLDPGLYLAKVVLESENMPVSNIESFRWAVSKREAKITDLAVLDNMLMVGEESSVSVEFTGDSDIHDNETAELVFGIYDISERVIETQKRRIALSPVPQKEVFKVVAGQGARNVKINVKILKNGKEVDSREAVFSVKNRNDGKGKSGGQINYMLILLLAAIPGIFVLLSYSFIKTSHKTR